MDSLDRIAPDNKLGMVETGMMNEMTVAVVNTFFRKRPSQLMPYTRRSASGGQGEEEGAQSMVPVPHRQQSPTI